MIYNILNMQRDAEGIVVAVSYTITVSDGVDSYTHEFFTGLPKPSGNIINYDNLTESQVIEWVKELQGDDAEEQAFEEFKASIERKRLINGKPW